MWFQSCFQYVKCWILFFLSPSHPTHKKIPKLGWKDKDTINKLSFKGPFPPQPFQNFNILCSTLKVAEFVLRFVTDPENRNPKKIPFWVELSESWWFPALYSLHSNLTPVGLTEPFLCCQNSTFFLFLKAKPEEKAFDAIPVSLIKKPGRLWSSLIMGRGFQNKFNGFGKGMHKPFLQSFVCFRFPLMAPFQEF